MAECREGLWLHDSFNSDHRLENRQRSGSEAVDPSSGGSAASDSMPMADGSRVAPKPDAAIVVADTSAASQQADARGGDEQLLRSVLRTPSTPLIDALHATITLSKTNQLYVDSSKYEAIRVHLCEENRIRTQVSSAEHAQLTRRIFHDLYVLGASAFMVLARNEVERTLTNVVADIARRPDGVVLSITEQSRYDETPMYARATTCHMLGDIPGLDLVPFDSRVLDIGRQSLGWTVDVAQHAAPTNLL